MKYENDDSEVLMFLWQEGRGQKNRRNHDMESTTEEGCYEVYERALQWALNDEGDFARRKLEGRMEAITWIKVKKWVPC